MVLWWVASMEYDLVDWTDSHTAAEMVAMTAGKMVGMKAVK